MKEDLGNVTPVVLTEGEDPGAVRFDVPYQLVTILLRLFPHLTDGKVAVVTRRCDEKAINELSKRGLLDAKRIVPVGLACSAAQVATCRCSDPVPSVVDFGEPHEPFPSDVLAEELANAAAEDRLRFWVRQFRKCNKCFACSTMCPVCFCDHCVLEEEHFVKEKSIPPGMTFHLIRSFHLADKCIECGECERACPANIPLLTLRKMVRADMKDLFGYTSGDDKAISPLLTTLEGKPLEGETDEY